MSFSFGNGQNSYSYQGSNEEVFLKKKQFDVDLNKLNLKKTIDDVSLFDIITEDDLNDTGSQLRSSDLFADIEPQYDGPKWLGLTGKGTFGQEPKLMQTTYLNGPPQQTDNKGNKIKKPDDGNDWSWNTFA